MKDVRGKLSYRRVLRSFRCPRWRGSRGFPASSSSRIDPSSAVAEAPALLPALCKFKRLPTRLAEVQLGRVMREYPNPMDSKEGSRLKEEAGEDAVACWRSARLSRRGAGTGGPPLPSQPAPPSSERNDASRCITSSSLSLSALSLSLYFSFPPPLTRPLSSS